MTLFRDNMPTVQDPQGTLNNSATLRALGQPGSRQAILESIMRMIPPNAIPGELLDLYDGQQEWHGPKETPYDNPHDDFYDEISSKGRRFFSGQMPESANTANMLKHIRAMGLEAEEG